MMAITSNFIVLDSEHAKLMAERWVAEFDVKREEIYASLADTPGSDEDGIVRAMVDITIHKGLSLRQYQKHVIETYSYYQMHHCDDDLLEQLISGTESADIHDLIQMTCEFQTMGVANQDILSIVPLDLKGAVGFIFQPKLR